MAWIAVDRDDREYLFEEEPIRLIITTTRAGHWISREDAIKKGIMRVPEGSSLSLTGKQMSWKDKPVRLK